MKAIDVGYRHFDSAYLYLNEEEIGRAIQKKIADGSVKREDVFYTSKVLCIVPYVSVKSSLSEEFLGEVLLLLVKFSFPQTLHCKKVYAEGGVHDGKGCGFQLLRALGLISQPMAWSIDIPCLFPMKWEDNTTELL